MALATPPPPLHELRPLTPQELTREYVSGGYLGWYGEYARALPYAIDDISSDFGDDIYARMLLDAQVNAAFTVYKASILETGLTLLPAIDDAADPDYETATLICDEATAMLDQLQTPLMDVLNDLLDAAAFGHKVAEQVYVYRAGADGQRRLYLRALKPKPRRTTAFVVDAYLNVLGLLGLIPGQAWTMALPGAVLDPALLPNLLPRERFLVVTWRPRDGDPRGTSILRPAYDPWWRKRQILPEYLKYLSQFAGPSLIGFTPEGATTQPPADSLGNPTAAEPVTPEQAMLAALQSFRNGTAAAFPFGAQVQPVDMQGDGAAFLRALAQCDQQITKSILTQELATEEGEHSTRAQAQVHQDVLDTLIRQGKQTIVRAFTFDVLRNWVRYNWGDQALHLVPQTSLGSTEAQDVAPLMNAVAALERAGYLHPSQYADVDDMLNLPERDLSWQPPADAYVVPVETPQAQQLPASQGAGLLPAAPSPAAPGTAPAATGPTPPAPPSDPTRIAVRAHSRNRRPPAAQRGAA